MREIAGFCLAGLSGRASVAPLIAAAICLPLPAQARDAAISIPPTTLDVALVMLARQAGVEIISTEAGLRSVRTPAVQGTMPVRTALDRLLAGTGYRAEGTAGGYRIVRAPPPRRAPLSRPAAPPLPPPPPSPTPEVVVTASKQPIPLLRYPGSLTVIAALPVTPAQQAGDMTDMARSMPILQSTQLGAGRNKVFIRGVADSSFNGSTQSPASLYLDDVQLNYSGPDPGLRLYDMRSIEVLEGPQGTLYGAGAIGGVIRMTSNPVELSRSAAAVSAGTTVMRGGSQGFDGAGMVNLPIANDRLGLRVVGYDVRDGGFIDDAGRGRSRVNRSDTIGGRAAVRFEPGGGWRIDASGVGQRIETRDGQYADTIEGPLTRRSRIAQPFDNSLLLGRLVITKTWDSGLNLVTATGVVGYRSTDQFDATPRPTTGAPIPVTTIYKARHNKILLSQEARLSRSLPGGGSWVAGFTLVSDRDILSRSLGSPGNDLDIIGVTNVTKAASAFGEATFVIAKGVSVTGGARVTTARTDGSPSSTPRSNNFVKGRLTRRIDPTLAVSWRVTSDMALFARFQTGYRTGGLAVSSGVGRVSDFQPDEITVGELGIRKLRRRPLGLAFSASLSMAHWTNIQADLVNRRGQPYTANIGDARIETAEANIDWIPIDGLRLSASFLFTDNKVSGPLADLSKRNNRRLPETPAFAAHGSASYTWRMGATSPRIGLTADYVGRSVLGTGDLLDVSQGKYWVVGMSAGLRWKRVDFDLSADNVTNSTANRFAFGNPFSLTYRDQTTPLRPTNIRFAVGISW